MFVFCIGGVSSPLHFESAGSSPLRPNHVVIHSMWKIHGWMVQQLNQIHPNHSKSTLKASISFFNPRKKSLWIPFQHISTECQSFISRFSVSNSCRQLASCTLWHPTCPVGRPTSSTRWEKKNPDLKSLEANRGNMFDFKHSLLFNVFKPSLGMISWPRFSGLQPSKYCSDEPLRRQCGPVVTMMRTTAQTIMLAKGLFEHSVSLYPLVKYVSFLFNGDHPYTWSVFPTFWIWISRIMQLVLYLLHPINSFNI